MKPLKAAASTSQPVLTNQDIQIIFFQVPELYDIHTEFYEGLKQRIGQEDPQDSVGDLFQRLVNQLGVYRAFLDNYKSAVETAQRCAQADERFKTLVEQMKPSKKFSDNKNTYTMEGLLYKPVDRVTRNMLVLHDLLKHTPQSHADHVVLQEVVRISNNFLSGVNEETKQKRSSFALSKGKTRQLVKDGFLVEVSDGIRRVRHMFLFTDILLCAQLKPGKQPHYKYEWYIPTTDLTLLCPGEEGSLTSIPMEPPELITEARRKIYQAKLEIQQEKKTSRGMTGKALERTKKKLADLQSSLLKNSPMMPLALHGRNGKVGNADPEFTTLTSYDLIKLTNSLVKLRTTHTPPLHSGMDDLYCCLEVDTLGYFERRAETRVLTDSISPSWEEPAQVGRSFFKTSRCDRGRLEMSNSRGAALWKYLRLKLRMKKLDPKSLQPKEWKLTLLKLGTVELSLSLRYNAHTLPPPGIPPLAHTEVFGVPIGDVTKREGSTIPLIVQECVKEVDRRGLEEEGIYRVSGIATRVQDLKAAFNTNAKDVSSRVREADVHVVAGTLKLYLRELPEALLTDELFPEFCRCVAMTDPVAKESHMINTLQSLPEPNRKTFLFLLDHLKRIASNKPVNKMTHSNLATVFGPSLLRSPQTDSSSGKCMDVSQEVVVQSQVVLFYLQHQNLPAADAKEQSHLASAET
nr:PREDICTED: breakpoint cluster region protein-like [Latimeria chalumnae]|eukprot:XP_014353913.1 PREDICTED: breakpoint cluster region protein-like [Latimeria chalumnae]